MYNHDSQGVCTAYVEAPGPHGDEDISLNSIHSEMRYVNALLLTQLSHGEDLHKSFCMHAFYS